jgi:hypothetical protein
MSEKDYMRHTGLLLASLLLVAACSGEERGAAKDLAALAPLPGSELTASDDKADAPGQKIVRGDKLKVGQKVSSDFTARRGWIAYPIELVGGQQVDLTVGGAEDTMVWVYGPRQANGQYPADALAFNDDETPGAVLSSRLFLDVPADGTYRVLVSTWDNYSAYPNNVSRGAYEVRATCASAGFGVCGPAISYEGEQCWADADCQAVPAAQGAHCEGEIVCAADTNCFWVNEGFCRGNYVWLTYAPKQCGTNGWQQATVVGDGVDGNTPEGELTLVDRYFEDRGIDLLEVGFAGRPEPMATCAACSCARGDLLVVKARAHQADKLVSQFGFTRVESGAQLAPKSCGMNPWPNAETVGAGSAEELQAIGEWTESLGAPLAWVGHLYSTTARATCRACTCPRGDTLFVLPVGDAAPLFESGFSPLHLE